MRRLDPSRYPRSSVESGVILANPSRRFLSIGSGSLSCFDVNLARYFQRHRWEETRRRCAWGYLRLSQQVSSIVAGLKVGDPLGQLRNESIEAAQVLRRPGAA